MNDITKEGPKETKHLLERKAISNQWSHMEHAHFLNSSRVGMWLIMLMIITTLLISPFHVELMSLFKNLER